MLLSKKILFYYKKRKPIKYSRHLGVRIGDNVVIGAGSIVTRNLTSNNVYAGVPAKLIMSIEEYAEKSLSKTPKYDLKNYISNKKEELTRIFLEDNGDNDE